MSLEPKTLILLAPIAIVALFINAYVIKKGINFGYFNS